MNRAACTTLIVDPPPDADRAGAAPLRITLPAGDAGTDATIAAMQQLVADAVPRILVPVGWRPMRNGTALYGWFRKVFAFRADPPGQERLQNPLALWEQLQRGPVAGDCDDLAVLACTLLIASGHRASFIVVGRQPAPAPFQHVFYGIGGMTPRPAVDHLPAYTIPYDPQERTPPGEMPAGVQRVRVYPA